MAEPSILLLWRGLTLRRDAVSLGLGEIGKFGYELTIPANVSDVGTWGRL
jgi:hypothetical protein